MLLSYTTVRAPSVKEVTDVEPVASVCETLIVPHVDKPVAEEKSNITLRLLVPLPIGNLPASIKVVGRPDVPNHLLNVPDPVRKPLVQTRVPVDDVAVPSVRVCPLRAILPFLILSAKALDKSELSEKPLVLSKEKLSEPLNVPEFVTVCKDEPLKTITAFVVDPLSVTTPVPVIEKLPATISIP